MWFLKLQLHIEKKSLLMHEIQRKRSTLQNIQSAICQKHLYLGLFFFIDSEAERYNIARNIKFKAFWRPFFRWYTSSSVKYTLSSLIWSQMNYSTIIITIDTWVTRIAFKKVLIEKTTFEVRHFVTETRNTKINYFYCFQREVIYGQNLG